MRFSEMAATATGRTTRRTRPATRFVAIPMPKQWAFLYPRRRLHARPAEREAERSRSRCRTVTGASRKPSGPRARNYGVDCCCQVVISDETYVRPEGFRAGRRLRHRPSIFYRDDRQRRAAERPRALWRADRAGPVRHLHGRKSARRAGVQRHYDQRESRAAGSSRRPASAASSPAAHLGRTRPARPTTTSPPRGQTTGRGQPVTMVIGLLGAARGQHLWQPLRQASRAAFMGLALLAPIVASAQAPARSSAAFQNPGACASGGGGGERRCAGSRCRQRRRRGSCPAPAPDYTTVLNSSDAERKKIQESLRTLDKYNGPIDGNLQSEVTVKAIGDWQKGRNTPVVGKLTPQEAAQLNAEATCAPIRRLESPPPQTAAPVLLAPPRPPNADALKALQDRPRGASQGGGARAPTPRRRRWYATARRPSRPTARASRGTSPRPSPSGTPTTRRPAALSARSRPRSTITATPRPAPRRRPSEARDQAGRQDLRPVPGLRLMTKAARARIRSPSPATTSPRSRSGRPIRPSRAPGGNRIS